MRYFLIMVFSFSLLLLTACASQPPKFYVLTHEKSLPSQPSPRPSLYIGLGPIEIPKYIQKPQIVTRLNSNQIEANEFHRWGEPLQSNIERVIQHNLTTFIPSDFIILFPWRFNQRIDYQIHISIITFETNANLMSNLLVKWSITDKQDRKVYIVETSLYQHPVLLTAQHQVTYDALVAAMNADLNAFSHTLANAVRRLGSVEH